MYKPSPTRALSGPQTMLASLLSLVLLITPLAPLSAAAQTRRLAPQPVGSAAPQAQQPTKAPPVKLPAPKPAPGDAPAAVNIVASKTDNRTAAQTVGPTNTINYTVTLQNTGTTDATGVVLSDTIDPNTTLVPGSIVSTPLANPDSYNVIGNVRIQPTAAQGLLANDSNPDNGNNTGLTASGPSTTTQGGNLTVNADGSFSYNPAPGFTGTDSFTYTITVTATGKTDTGTVTLSVGNGTNTPGTSVIWFINNDPAAPAGNDGRSTSPFNSIAAYNASAPTKDPGDIIFLYTGTANYVGTLTLAANQKVVGQGASDTLVNISGFTVPTGSDTLPATGGTNPTLTTTAAAANALIVSAGGITLRGLTVGNTTGAKIFGSTFGTLTAGNIFTPDLTLNGTGQAMSLTNGAFSAASGFTGVTTTSSSGAPGINLNTIAGTISFGPTSVSNAGTQGINIAGSTMTATFGSTNVSSATSQGILVGTTSGTINFSNTTVTGGTDGVSFQNNSGANARTFGTLTVSGGSGTAFLSGAGGGNVTVNGAATLSSAGNAIDVQSLTSGSAVTFNAATSATRTAAGGVGVNLATNTGSTFTFNSLAITTNAGTGLSATGGGTITVTNGTGAINSTPQAAAAIIANGVTLNANFSSIAASGGTNGVSLTNVAGTSNFGTGSLTGATGAEFLVSGGNPTVTYTGSITQNNAARVVDIQGTTANTITLSGTVTGGASSTGVHIGDTTAVNGNVSFTTLNLGTSGSRMANQAVTITNGTGTYSLGAVTIFTNNAQGIVATNADGTLNSTSGTVDTGTATAINIDGPAGLTTLGMTLTQVNASGGTAAGISIQDTGGSFTVAGTGGTCTVATPTCTGGTISNKTGGDVISGGLPTGGSNGVGVFLNNATSITLTSMRLHDFTNFAILGSSGGVNGFTFTNSITDGVNGDNENADDASVAFYGLTGSASITNSTVQGGREDNFRVINTSGTLNRITFDNFTEGPMDLGNASGDNGVFLQAQNNATMNVTIQNSFLTSARGDLFQFDLTNTAHGDLIFKNNDCINTHPNVVVGGGGMTISGGGSTNSNVVLTYDIGGATAADGNVFRGARGDGLLIALQVGGGTFTGKIRNNIFGVAGTDQSGSREASDLEVRTVGSGNQTLLVDSNQIFQYGNFGFLLQVGNKANGNGTDGSMNATVTNNIINSPSSFAFIKNGFQLNSGTNAGDAFQVCLNLSSNTLGGSGQNGGNDFQLRNRFTTTDKLPGYGGANNDNAAVVAFIQGQNTGAETGNASNNVAGGSGGFVGGAACTQPSFAAPFAETGTVEEELATVPTATDTTVASAPAPRNDITAQPFVVMPRPAPQVAPVAPFSAPVAKPTTPRTTPAPVPPVHVIPNPAPQSGETVSITIGTLGANKTVTITFSVTVNNPLAANVTQISNQGTVSGTGFASVLTDDPDVAGQQATITGVIPQPTITIKNASVPRPTSGTTTMPFSVTLSNAYTVPVTVNYQTADGTAVAGTDYTTTSGTLSFPVGATFQTISVPILSNAAAVGDKTFTVTLSAPVSGTISGSGIGTGTITAANTPGTTLISELRTSGPGTTGTGDLNDDFVEVYNNTAIPITVSASDASAGWALVKSGATCTDQPLIVGTIPNGTVIPARGHYLLVGSGYSLGSYATSNQTLTANIENDKNVVLFNTANVANFATGTRLDAVGGDSNTGSNCDLLREGTNLPATAGSISQYSFVRRAATGTPQDTNDNAADFGIVSTTPLVAVGSTATPVAGAPGPENLVSPIQRNATLKASLIDLTQASTASPNRVRDTNSYTDTLTPSAPNGGAPASNPYTSGTLDIRRKFTNNTGAAVTKLRFRVVDITTTNTPGAGLADIRLLSSGNTTANGGAITISGTTVEQPATQARGGGLNTSVVVAIPGNSLVNGGSINVRFLLGIAQGGNYRFLINVEALP